LLETAFQLGHRSQLLLTLDQAGGEGVRVWLHGPQTKAFRDRAYHAPMPELAFVLPDTGADRTADLVAGLSEEVRRQDAAAVLGTDVPELGGDRVYVVLQGAGEGEVELAPAELLRTIVVLLAPPGSDRFAQGAELARRAGAVFHVNSVAVEQLHELGVPARHLQLGYSTSWDRFDPGPTREVEIAPAGDLELLPRAQLTILRNTHGYLDWPQALRAIHGGAVVLHEHALGLPPLVAGRHLFLARVEALDVVAAALLSDPARLEQVRLEALDFVRKALPLALAAAVLIGAARALVAQPLPVGTVSTPGQPTLRSK
jgi:hypothetical protein